MNTFTKSKNIKNVDNIKMDDIQFYGKKQLCFENIKNADVYIARDIKENEGFKEFTGMTKEMCINYCRVDNGFYEVTPDDKIIKSYWDIDGKWNDIKYGAAGNNEIYERYIDCFKDHVINFKDENNIERKTDLGIMTSLTDKKMSIHIIDNGISFKNKIDCAAYHKRLHTEFFKDDKMFNDTVDMCVYDNGKLFRSPNQTKFKKGAVPLKIVSNHKLDDSFVSINVDESTLFEVPEEWKEKPRKTTTIKKTNVKVDDELIEECEKMVDLQDPDAVNNYTPWLNVGFSLFNITQGHERGFDVWNNWSSTYPDYDEDECRRLWNRMQLGGRGMGSLIYDAKIANPDAFIKERLGKNNCFFDEPDQSDLAEMFMKVMGEEIKIICQKDLKNFTWNDDTKLWEEQGKESLQLLIKNTLKPIFKKKCEEIYSMELDAEGEEKKRLQKMKKQVEKIIKKIGSSSHVKGIMDFIKGERIDKDFETKTINKFAKGLPILYGKLIILETLVVRDRGIEDYYSFECPVEFLGEDADLSDVDKFYDGVFLYRKNLKNYAQRLNGYLLTGEISDRSLHIKYGNGCNGKSSENNILKAILGPYVAALSEDVMLKKTSKGASPELMPLLYARVGILPESDKKEELNSKRVKTITGDDTITARHLYGHEMEFKTQCKPIWATNFKPKINVDDQAILDRIKLIPYDARFEKTQENTEYIKDLQENKLSEFFTWYCLGARDWYAGKELTPCKEMLDGMNQYIAENDTIAEFLVEEYETISRSDYDALEKNEKSEWRVSKKNMYCNFISWCNENGNRDNLCSKKEFNDSFEKKCESIKFTGSWMYLCKSKMIEEERRSESGLPPM